ncbi:MAG: hypothetical protein AAF499_00860 [Pseudomonadota bacterium]
MATTQPAVETDRIAEATPAPVSVKLEIESRLSAQLEQAVTFRVDFEKTVDAFQFLTGHPISPSGQRIDIANTPFSDDYAEGYFDDQFIALVRRDSGSDSDQLIEFDYGATDAPFIDWAETHGVPMCLFSTQSDCE